MENKIKKFALNSIKVHPVKREWRLAIIIVGVFRIATMFLSWYAGLYYFKSLINPFLNSYIISLVLAVTLLFLLETLIAIFLSKFFKFLYKAKLATAIPVFLVVALLWAVSFHISTNGLAQRRSDQVNQTKQITEKYEIQSKQIKKRNNTRIKELRKSIKEIRENPAGYAAGASEPSILTGEQQKQIQSYYNQISEIEKNKRSQLSELDEEKKQKLSQNRQKTTSEASKYYKVIGAIMIFQFLLTGIFIFLLSRVFKQEDGQDYVSEKLEPIQENIQETMLETVTSYASLLQQKVAESMQTVLVDEKDKVLQPTQNSAKDNEPESEPETSYKDNNIGFVTGNSTNTNEKNEKNNSNLQLNFKHNKNNKNPVKTSQDILQTYDLQGNESYYIKKYPEVVRNLIKRSNNKSVSNPRPKITHIAKDTNTSVSTVYNVKRIVEQYIK